MIPELSVAVAFYGVPPADKVDYSQVKAPILTHLAANDPWATVAAAEESQRQIEARGQSMNPGASRIAIAAGTLDMRWLRRCGFS